MAQTPSRSRSDAFGGEFLATHAIAIACLLVFALAVALDKRLPIFPERNFGLPFRTSTLLRLGVLVPALVPSEPWRLLSAVFLHYNALHIAMNLYGLVALGRTLEARFGPARSLLIFVGAGLGGFVVSYFWTDAGTAGASGGVFGQLGAVIGVLVARRLPGWKDLLFQNLAYALLMGFMFRVNNAAHLGGFVVGFGLGYALDKERVRPVTNQVFNALAGLAALASVASVALCTTSPYPKFVRQQELRQGD
jgi:membrane associated rhomboid family serine protease